MRVTRDGYQWTQADYLLASAVDALRVLVWQQTKDGHAGRNQPTPWPRPGETNPNETRIGGKGGWSLEDMRRKLDAWPGRKREKPEEVISGD